MLDINTYLLIFFISCYILIKKSLYIIILIPLFFTIQNLFFIFYNDFYSSLDKNFAFLYLLLIGKLYVLIKGSNKINYYKIILSYIIIPIIFLSLSKIIITKLNYKDISYEIMIITIILISYIDIYNLKFNNFKQTLKNLTINFYGFLITSIILFGLKIYLLMQNIKNPSFYYLFLTIPISLLIIYFYIKDLQLVIKSLKEISNDSDKDMKNLI